MPTLQRLRVLTLIGASACLALTTCGSSTSGATGASSASSGGSAAAAAVSCPNGQIRFGIEPYEDPAKLTPAYTVLANALQTRLGCPVKLQIVESYAAEVLAMRNHQLEMAEFGPLGQAVVGGDGRGRPGAGRRAAHQRCTRGTGERERRPSRGDAAVRGLLLYRLDVNVRASLVLGLVGAGGIGFLIDQAVNLFRFDQMITYIAIVLVMIIAVDQLSAAVRRRIAG